MTGSDRRPWVGGNWKCNGTLAELLDLCKTFSDSFTNDDANIEVCIFPPSVYALETRKHLPAGWGVGLQNVSKTGKGAYTGEITVSMIMDVNCANTLLGHSERRVLYGETDGDVCDKLKETSGAKVRAIICIGETLEEYDAGKTIDVVKKQLDAVLGHCDASRDIIAYEPVWAIGTGKVATPEIAQKVHAEIRSHIEKKSSKAAADAMRIVYGGSANSANCKELIAQPDIDGFLVGGASLKPAFVDILKACRKGP